MIETEWFAVHTRYQHEKCVESALKGKGLKTFLPTYKEIRQWGDRKKVISTPLFPGYIFASDAHERKFDILSAPGACAIVSVRGIPAAIPQEEMETVMRVAAFAENLQPHPFLRRGDVVRVIAGPLAGVEGALVSDKGKFWLVISVQLLGRSAAVAVERASVAPVHASGSAGREHEIARILFPESNQPDGCLVRPA
ncbi:MAG TPA: UpxY family transcription antiterminator [Verrucomicrobiae bacterium]|nr:UpxY family transcription antiterminator [Verrucomicrobiae bacterium]